MRVCQTDKQMIECQAAWMQLMGLGWMAVGVHAATNVFDLSAKPIKPTGIIAIDIKPCEGCSAAIFEFGALLHFDVKGAG